MGIYIQYILYSLILVISNVGGVMFFLHVMLFPTFLDKNYSGNTKKKIQKLFFSFNVFFVFFMLDLFPTFKKKFIFWEILKSAPLLTG